MTVDRAAGPAPLADLPEGVRHALLAAAPNFRDAGGLPAGPDAWMCSGVVFRTGQLVGLPPEAQQALTALNVGTVFDLRTGLERGPNPDTLPDGITLVVADVLADDPSSGATAVAALGGRSGGEVPVARINELLGGGRARSLMLDTYRDFVRLESARQAYGAFIRGVADGDTALAFHCTAGKDRTGWGAAVLQMHAGVDDDTIMAEYLASNDRTSGQYGPLVAAFAQAGGDGEALQWLVDVHPEYLHAAIAQMRTDYGDVIGYLRAGLALTDMDLDRLARRVRTA